MTDAEFSAFREAASFPKSMLHSTIADKVWLDLARGDLADAVFTAFRAVEEAVRKAGSYTNAEIGVDLMRKAFNPNDGPLTDMQQEKGEREALSHMFRWSYGLIQEPSLSPHRHNNRSSGGTGDGDARFTPASDRRRPRREKDVWHRINRNNPCP